MPYLRRVCPCLGGSQLDGLRRESVVEPGGLFDQPHHGLPETSRRGPVHDVVIDGEGNVQRLAGLGVPPGVAVSVRQNRVGIVMGDAILFAAGQVELSTPGRNVLRRLLPVLLAAPGDIVVEGHTDATPTVGGRFPSNWELSAARASSVVRTLVELGVPARRLSAVGYADTRPMAAGRDPASNARNRRVAISLQADE